MHYICIVFFMVLDLRFTKDWLPGGNQFFLSLHDSLCMAFNALNI